MVVDDNGVSSASIGSLLCAVYDQLVAGAALEEKQPILIIFDNKTQIVQIVQISAVVSLKAGVTVTTHF
jgi:hypothetical protein